MAGEKTDRNQSGNQSSNSGGGQGGNANKGPSKNNNRRRSLRSKRRTGRKPEESSSEVREQRPQTPAPKPVEKSVRENRERRRRRRMRARQRGQNESQTPVIEDILKDLPPLVPAFVYTHVLRPAVRDSFEFRTEHFSKVTRRMEDFHIDLSPLYPDGGDEIKGVAYMPPLDLDALDGDLTDEELDARDAAAAASIGDGYDDPNWDAEQAADAARLDGVADDFYDEMDDSVLDEYPNEDIDA